MLPNLPGHMVVAAMRELPGITPWQETLQAMNLIGSHDTHRIISLLGDPGLVNPRNLFHARARSEAL